MNIFVSGSLAFDRIMTFPGKFSDHILPDKIHILNVCFLVDGMDEKFGGTAGNIAYNLALLGEKPLILSAVGRDFARYEQRLRKLGLSLEGIRTIENEFTAGAYITTDKSDNQITGFNPGAMRQPSNFAFDRMHPADAALAVIAPGNVEDMLGYAARYRELGIPYIFDPGQQITALSGEQMVAAFTGSKILISNDYELELIMNATSMTKPEIMNRTGALITTLGENGSVVANGGGETRIPAARISRAVDPTGAGDAYRSGLIKGLSQGRDLVESAKVGATCAAYCVESHGTQDHAFTEEEFWARHTENFG
ncbi:MAG: carbohydrate kinase family protein [Desulfovibrionaceae bacterium]|jgi:adenosine kinase|nr:carbohydrate kinase family protein [Desulfovibrionaceae bacterium]